MACTFFLGDIGVYNDDYIYNLRDPATGAIEGLTFHRPWHVWRPLTRIAFPPVVTALWPHPWMLHALDALLHATVTAALYALLRRMGVRRGIAAPCAMAFMVYPGHFEAVLWISVTCTLISMLLVLASWGMYLWWLGRSHLASVPVRIGALASFGGLAWCAAALNEQPTGALAALPLAAVAVGPAVGSSRLNRLVRTLLPVVSTTIGLAVYLRGFVRHTPGFKGIDVVEHGAPTRVLELARAVPGEAILVNFVRGAWRQGVEAITGHPVSALVVVGVFAAAALPWCWRGSRSDEAATALRPVRSGALVIAGLVWAAAVWLPVAFAHSHPFPRLFYPFALGIAIAGAGFATWVSECKPIRSAGLLRLLRVAFAAAVCAAVVVWIGVQDGYQRRYRADVAESMALRDAFERTIEPGSIFIPVHLTSRPTSTDVPGFDGFFQHCWRWPLASGWNLLLALHSSDVHTVCTGNGAASVGLWLNPRDPAGSIVCASPMTTPKPANAGERFPLSPDAPGRVFALDRLVLFDIDGAGNTRVYTKVRIHPAASDVLEIVPRQVARSPLAASLPERILNVFPAPRPPETHAQR